MNKRRVGGRIGRPFVRVMWNEAANELMIDQRMPALADGGTPERMSGMGEAEKYLGQQIIGDDIGHVFGCRSFWWRCFFNIIDLLPDSLSL